MGRRLDRADRRGRGRGRGRAPGDRDEPVRRGARGGARGELGPTPGGDRLADRDGQRIPLARGLGSSAAATVGGVVAGDALRLGGARPSTTPTLLRLATTIEGHPDNAAAGAARRVRRLARHLGDGSRRSGSTRPRGLRCVLFIPERRLATEEMRRVLPDEVPLRRRRREPGPGRDRRRRASPPAGSSCSRDLTVDRLHEPYRAAAYPELPRLTLAAARGRRARRVPVRAPGRRSSRSSRRASDTAPVEAALRDEAAAVRAGGPRSRSSRRGTPARAWSRARRSGARITAHASAVPSGVVTLTRSVSRKP